MDYIKIHSRADEESFALSNDSLDFIVDLGELVLNYGDCNHVSSGSAGCTQGFL